MTLSLPTGDTERDGTHLPNYSLVKLGARFLAHPSTVNQWVNWGGGRVDFSGDEPLEFTVVGVESPDSPAHAIVELEAEGVRKKVHASLLYNAGTFSLI